MAFGVWKDHKAAWDHGVRCHGKLAMVITAIFAPLWLPLYGAALLLKNSCLKAGEFGEWLDGKL